MGAAIASKRKEGEEVNVDATTRRIATAIVGLGYIVCLVSLAYASWTHDGVNTDRLVWFGLGSLVIMAVLLLGEAVVVGLLRAFGIPVPTLPLPAPTPPASGASDTPGGA